jgi:hypothetical protein
MWSRGDVVALRDIWFGAVWRAVAGIVVEETPERTVFWVPAGSESTYPVDDGGDEIRIPRPDFRHGTRRAKNPIVVVCDEGAPWTLWLFFRELGAFSHWYVNFERYLGRSLHAYDSVDHKLDLIVRPGERLEWKDEHELEEAGRLGLVDADAIRRDAELILTEHPWPTGWENYTPDPSWEAPELPESWDQV